MGGKRFVFAVMGALELLTVLLGWPLMAAGPRRTAHRPAGISLRRRLHVSDLITAPGRVDLEWSNSASVSGDYLMPTTLHFTPDTNRLYWGTTELSISADIVDSDTTTAAHRVTHSSDHVGIALTSVIYTTDRFSLAVAPTASLWLRDNGGIRAGVNTIGRWDVGSSSFGFTASWTGANRPSESNPAGTWDVGAGYGRQLASSGRLSRWTPFVNLVWERPTGYASQTSLFEGAECQISDRAALDITAQHVGLGGGVDHQIMVGLTISFGR